MICMNEQSNPGMGAVLMLWMDLRWLSRTLCVQVLSSVTTHAQSSAASLPPHPTRENLSQVAASDGDIKAALERPQVRGLEEKVQNEMILRVRDAQKNLLLPPDAGLKQKVAKGQWQEKFTALGPILPVGRVDTPISPGMNRWKNSGRDIELEAGDTLTFPKWRGHITVKGVVFNSTAVSYRPRRRRGRREKGSMISHRQEEEANE
jgi:hypothetical protein